MGIDAKLFERSDDVQRQISAQASKKIEGCVRCAVPNLPKAA
jgi:hypothetical protein